MKKYIFPIGVLIFVCVIGFVITHSTQPEKHNEVKIIEGWKHISFDQTGNSYYIDINTIVNDGYDSDKDELLFHATFLKLYSDKGREELIQAYNNNGVDTAQMSEVDHEIDVMSFRDLKGDKYITGAECKFYNVDNVEIPSINMSVAFEQTDETRPIPPSSIGENLYDYAYNRVKKD
ncbi:MAG: hypothetical protein IJ862_07465 [Selenomonadaceae bacterium]|nr:hypothetical protein [Selenomonadaceae bacterium]